MDQGWRGNRNLEGKNNLRNSLPPPPGHASSGAASVEGTGLCCRSTLSEELHGVRAAFSISSGAEDVAPEG